MASFRSAQRGSKPPGSNYAAMTVVYATGPVSSGKSALGVRLELRSAGKPIAE